jgi:hypothetical protein
MIVSSVPTMFIDLVAFARCHTGPQLNKFDRPYSRGTDHDSRKKPPKEVLSSVAGCYAKPAFITLVSR